VLSVRPRGTTRLPLDGFFTKFYVGGLYDNLSRKIQAFLKSDKNNGYFTRRPLYICNDILLS